MSAPIHQWLDFSVAEDGGERLYRLGFAERHIGNPAIRALHGGAIATFLECAAQEELGREARGDAKLETVNIDIDYLTSSKPEDMTACVRITRLGRRIAFVEATGWQGERARPVAIARIRFKIVRPPIES